MLTGDKLETATCTAKNAHLITRNHDIHIFRPVSARQQPLFLLQADKVANSRFSDHGVQILSLLPELLACGGQYPSSG